MTAQRESDNLDDGKPHSARVWNYWLGGKDNFAADREAAARFLETYPEIADIARAGRGFLVRTVRYLAGEIGIRQFLDVGCGLPTVDNTHEVAQRIAPGSRVVYVDSDPLVLARAGALLTSAPEGATAYIEADVRDPEAILRQARDTLDLDRPVSLMMLGITGHIADKEDPWSIVRCLLDGLASDSYLTLSDGSDVSDDRAAAHERYAQAGAVPYHLRSPAQIGRYFEGLTLLEPGFVPISQWRPEDAMPGDRGAVTTFGGVGRKP